MLYRTDSNGNLIKIAGNTNGVYGGNSLPVGSIFSSAIPQTSNNYHLLNGDSISISGIYSGFYNLINTLVSQGYNLTCTANEYAEDIAKTGNCGKFVINTTDSTITGTYTDANDNTTTINVSATSLKLPTITMFIQGLSNLTNIGDSLEAGLPNITGFKRTSWSDASGGGIITSSGAGQNGGALYSYHEGTAYFSAASNSSTTSTHLNYMGLDASLSNAIYGNSTTVQPIATQYPYYIVLISGSALSIEANPTLSGSEQNLNSIGIGGVNYKILNNEEIWVINDTPTLSSSVTYNINFTSNENIYTELSLTSSSITYGNTQVYDGATWINNNYKEIQFETAPTGDLLTWLESNAIKTEFATKAYVNNLIIATINGSY